MKFCFYFPSLSEILLFSSSGMMGKIECKICIGLCSSFASPETHLTFREITCTKKDLKAIDVAASLTRGLQGCGCVVRLWGKDLEFSPLSQPVRE